MSRDRDRRLAEWAGFKWCGEPIYGPGDGTPKGWHNPRGDACNGYPSFPADVSACFEWLIPKLSKSGLGVTVVVFDCGQMFWPKQAVKVSLHNPRRENSSDVAEAYADIKDGNSGEATALALCSAVEALPDQYRGV